ncbi:jg20546 [Pararge aegeria aegeria]|uniref:Jg20546 protein n=1 Tax=Pararge aegeria aegeria TaxID=348720 RepID=A0A8S4S0A6_9NEOP|nr:jg20546 [Pararge aegeria aegeria]
MPAATRHGVTASQRDGTVDAACEAALAGCGGRERRVGSSRDVRLARLQATTGGTRQARRPQAARTAQPAHGWVFTVTLLTPHQIISHRIIPHALKHNCK